MATKRIPIKAAREFAKQFGLNQVIIVGYSKENNMTHVTTYGRSLDECVQAASGGNRIKKEILGWPEEHCHEMPARAKRKGIYG